ncbi:MAG: hypothetical protein M1835_002400 [Candelina submexicana]|nr:MAG: hypothetical protein M1835_002400 [Candelina submexicana]
MAPLEVGDKLPIDVVFSYLPYDVKEDMELTPEEKKELICKAPEYYNASHEWANKKVALFAMPGAFTPGCSGQQIPGLKATLAKFKTQGYDTIVALTYNDPWVMQAWRKENGIKDEILFLTDVDTRFSKNLTWNQGDRTSRYVLLLDRCQVVHAVKEEDFSQVTVTSADNIFHQMQLLKEEAEQS